MSRSTTRVGRPVRRIDGPLADDIFLVAGRPDEQHAAAFARPRRVPDELGLAPAQVARARQIDDPQLAVAEARARRARGRTRTRRRARRSGPARRSARRRPAPRRAPRRTPPARSRCRATRRRDRGTRARSRQLERRPRRSDEPLAPTSRSPGHGARAVRRAGHRAAARTRARSCARAVVEPEPRAPAAAAVEHRADRRIAAERAMPRAGSRSRRAPAPRRPARASRTRRSCGACAVAIAGIGCAPPAAPVGSAIERSCRATSASSPGDATSKPSSSSRREREHLWMRERLRREQRADPVACAASATRRMFAASAARSNTSVGRVQRSIAARSRQAGAVCTRAQPCRATYELTACSACGSTST